MTSSSSFSFLFLEDHEDVVAVVQNCSLLCVSLPNAYERKTRGTVWMTTHALCFEPKNDSDKDEDKEPGSRTTRTRTSALAQVFGESPGGTKRSERVEGKEAKIVKIKYEDAIGPSIDTSRVERNAVDISTAKAVLICGNERREIVRDETIVWRITMEEEEDGEESIEQRLRTPANKLLNISKQKNRQTKCEQLAFLSRQREGNLRFDEKNLRVKGETSRFDAPAAKISPLVRRAGRVRVTDAHLYFQPLIVRDSKAKKNIANWVALKDVVAVARRRYASRPVAVEVFYEVSDDDDVSNKSKSTMMRGSSVLFAFRSESAREAVIEALLKNKIDESESETTTLSRFLDPTNVEAISKVTNAWKIGDVSNFEYLMYLNALSGRSFHDVAQYFVFPWILKEYGGENDSNNGFNSDKHSSNSANIDVSEASVYRDLSKPIGALNPERLKYFQERMKHMEDMQKRNQHSQKPFLYGTHYSAPGYVLFYLLRCAPKHNLKLQNGSFDKPDRLFKSISETWSSCLNNNADLKELIPEFYIPECSRKFLRNNLKLNLGHRVRAHSKIDDVVLPQWAKNDPVRFTSINRKALESETTSVHLHEWIDLIFGVFQNDCKNKMNSFHPLTYEGEINVDDAASIDEQMSLETQINEFGQTPKRIFGDVHAKRRREAWRRWKDDGAVGAKRKTNRKSQSMISQLEYENLGTTTEDNDDDDDNDDEDEMVTPIPMDIRASVIDTIRLVSRRADDYLFVGDDDEEDAATNGIEALKLNDSPSRRAASPSNNMLERSFSDAHGIDTSLDKQIESVVLGNFRAPKPSDGDGADGSHVVKKWSRRTHNGAVTALECFADSNVAYSTGSDGFVRIIDMKNGHTIRAVPASSSTITNLAVLRQSVVASDARRLPIALYSTSNGNLFAYNGEYGSVDRVSSTNLTPITAIKVPSMSTEQGRAVTSHANGAIALRDIEKRVEVSVFGTNEFSGDGANDVLVDPQCHIIVSAHDSGVVKAFDTRSSALKSVWKQSVASRRNIAARSIAFAPLGDGLGDALGFIVAVDDSGQCCALETRMRGRIVAAADTTTTSSFANALVSANTSLRVNVDGEKNIVLSGFAQNVFRVGKEAGVLRDENDFRDLELRDDHDDDEKKKHNSPSERIFTAACFKTGSDRDVFVGAANGEVSAYAHRSSHIE